MWPTQAVRKKITRFSILFYKHWSEKCGVHMFSAPLSLILWMQLQQQILSITTSYFALKSSSESSLISIFFIAF